MKKTFFAIAAMLVAGITFVSCDNKKAEEETPSCCQNDSTQYDAELINVDTTVVDTVNGTVNVENVVTATPENVAQ